MSAVAIYARVSTSDQNNQIQVRELTEFAQRRGWAIAGIYPDQMSGAKAKRPGLDALMADARLRKFDAVLVWKLDRFGRSLVNCISGIQELAAHGVRFIAVSQGIDTDQANPTSALLMHILAAVAQFERELIRERVSAGLRHYGAQPEARRRSRSGKNLPVGRPRAIFNRIRAEEMRAAGHSYGAIARTLGVSAATLHREMAKASGDSCGR